MYKIKKSGCCMIIFLILVITLIWFHSVSAEVDKIASLTKVPSIPSRPEWNRFKILIWQYKTSVLNDFHLYQKVGLGGFHIDRGAGKENLVEFSLKERFPYYVDHSADKGFLHLREPDVQAVTGKYGLTIWRMPSTMKFLWGVMSSLAMWIAIPCLSCGSGIGSGIDTRRFIP
jgi:hypothetical protein